MSAQEIAQAFSDHYYNMRNTNPGQVGSLFSANSKMTFEGELFQGTEAIVGKLTAIGRAQHTVRTLDVQPSISDSSILIFTSGVVQIEGSVRSFRVISLPKFFCLFACAVFVTYRFVRLSHRSSSPPLLLLFLLLTGKPTSFLRVLPACGDRKVRRSCPCRKGFFWFYNIVVFPFTQK